MTFVLYKKKKLAVLFGSVAVAGEENDIEQPLLFEDVLGDKKVRAWPAGLSRVKDEDALKLLKGIVAAEAGIIAPPKSVPVTSDDGSVVYEEDKVTAYFNDFNQNVPSAHATWAKVWTPNGNSTKLTIIRKPTS